MCVRTVVAAQNITAAAARLGLSAAVRTAVSEPEVMLRLAERPAEIVLADTALARPDSASFTRRVLARSPGSVIVLFGGEDPQVASAALAAGARGLLRGTDDLVTAVAKTLLLLAAPGRRTPALLTEQSAAAPAPAVTATIGAAGAATHHPGAAAAGAATHHPGAAAAGTDSAGRSVTGAAEQTAAAVAGADPATGPNVVPNQRDDAAATAPAADTADAPAPVPHPDGAPTGGAPTGGASNDSAPDGGAPNGGVAHGAGPDGAQPSDGRVTALRRIGLTERELQVLRGMAEGKSNGEIGRDLFVSEDTVKTHARRLFRKLGARDRAHAVATGFRTGLVA
ncbi:helix-turn-helix transcriptional regulator [Solwaraspora sp. WMMD937]|uniref:response regulator transcription factor n=1 Tax=Solwaraspora sp. WMMD937 TaxID=3016090 RepID=UPI00249C0101|nr:helix-turn-helix transcriptional regulator [Solwaraspora sp. WMMD937]WFE24458.1 helix-turn-helix transcriptional regulator [Solwaraspora sp. WMMD937]